MLLLPVLNKSYIPASLRQEEEKQSARLLPYRVQSPPVTLTSTSAKKVTFTQTRVHKYLSERTQMDDISQGSSLYATSQLKLLHEDKETQLLLWAFGGAGRNPPGLSR